MNHIDVNQLKAINPRCEWTPAEFNYLEALARARRLFDSLRELFPNASFDDQVQDATYHAGIGIGANTAVRLSNFQRLACITSEERLQAAMRKQLVSLIESAGYTYVPFKVFGITFAERETGSGDLFTQLFDYT